MRKRSTAGQLQLHERQRLEYTKGYMEITLTINGRQYPYYPLLALLRVLQSQRLFNQITHPKRKENL